MLISVVTPTFNRAASFLPRCIASIQGQVGEGFEYEHVVVDDCSSDGTWDLLEAASRADARIRPLHLESNRGLAHALNRALDVARGDLILPLDDDDLLLPRSLQMHHEHMAQRPLLAWSFGQAIAIDEDDRVRAWPGEEGFFPADHSTDPAEFFESLLRRNTVINSTAVVRRRALLDVGGWDEEVSCPDWGLWLRLAHAGHQHHRRRTYLSCYRIHEHQLTSRHSNDGTYERDRRHHLRVYGRA